MSCPCENKNSFYDLSSGEIIELLKLSPNYDLNADEYEGEQNSNGCKIVKNKYRIVNSRLNTL
jgi:hypothetical protein